MESVAELLKKSYRPYSSLRDLLRCFLSTAVEVTRSTYGEIRLRSSESEAGHSDLSVTTDNEPGLQSANPDSATCAACELFLKGSYKAPAAAPDFQEQPLCKNAATSGSCLVAPVLYQGSSIGLVALTSDCLASYSTLDAEACRWIARQTAYHAVRYKVNRLSTSKQGKDLLLVGVSDGLTQLDSFIEKAAQVNLPVLITGEPGSGKARIAYAIHYASSYRDSSFLTLNCSEIDPQLLKSELYRLVGKVHRGTIFLKGIDALDQQMQNQLLGVIECGFGQLNSPQDKKTGIDLRMIASASQELGQMVEDGTFSRSLLWELNILQAQVPALRTRKEDIGPMAEYLLSKYSVQHQRSIAPEVLNVFESHSWPGNVNEFERVISRLAAMTDGEIITIDDVHIHAPDLSGDAGGLGKGTAPLNDPQGDSVNDNCQTVTNGTSLVAILIDQDYEALGHLHPSLQRALVFLAENFQDNISVGQLAQEAYLSASHLSFLFQKTLDVSIKQLLALVRIEKAKRLLIETPYVSIREISEQIGYGELRHFQRTFKRVVGTTPREYRRLELEKKSQTLSSFRAVMGRE
jgi:AraC-like DNA-binding protein